MNRVTARRSTSLLGLVLVLAAVATVAGPAWGASAPPAAKDKLATYSAEIR